MTSNIIVHHLEQSRSHRIVWLLELLKMPYEIKEYKRNPTTRLAPPELKEIHPLGKAPVIQDGDRTVAESGAIIMYLLEKENKLMPAIGTQERVQFHYWMHYAEGSLMPPLLMGLVFNTIPTKAPFFLRPILRPVFDKVMDSFVTPQLNDHTKMIEDHLGKNKWFAGGEEVTGADVQMSFPLEALYMWNTNKNGKEGCTNIANYLERIKQLPSYKAAEERGGELNISKI